MLGHNCRSKCNMALNLMKISEKTIRKVVSIFLLSMLGFLGFISFLFITGDANSVEAMFNALSSNISIAFENMISLNFSALISQWFQGVLSLLILAVLGLPFLLLSTKK